MTDSIQIFMPENACVGDRAELRYIFHPESELLPENQTHTDVPLDIPSFANQAENCQLLSASLDRFGTEYTLSLSLVGWKPGQIDFAPFTIGGHLLDLEPVEIHSVVEKTAVQGFRPPSPPLVVPGTTAVLALLAVFFIVVLSGALFALFHIPAIADFLTKSRAERLARRNMRAALKKLHALAAKKDDFGDKPFCAALQHILRNYFTKRFAEDFASVHTSALYEKISAICGGELTDGQDVLLQEILSLFTRADYIRYASETAAVLTPEEKDSLIESALHVVESLGGSDADL